MSEHLPILLAAMFGCYGMFRRKTRWIVFAILMVSLAAYWRIARIDMVVFRGHLHHLEWDHPRLEREHKR